MTTIEKYLTYVLGLLIIISLSFGGGYLYGKESQKVTEAQTAIKQVTVNAKATTDLANVATLADASASQGNIKVVTKYITITKQVTHYVKTNQNASDSLDSNFVRVFNNSANGNFTGNSTNNSTASQPVTSNASEPTATKGETLKAVTQHDEAYFTCKEGFDELFNFYNQVKVKINKK